MLQISSQKNKNISLAELDIQQVVKDVSEILSHRPMCKLPFRLHSLLLHIDAPETLETADDYLWSMQKILIDDKCMEQGAEFISICAALLLIRLTDFTAYELMYYRLFAISFTFFNYNK